MRIELPIPDSVAEAIRLPEDRVMIELQIELAVALYARGVLAFGKARELAGLSKYDFGRLLGERGIARHYGPEEVDDDLTYASSQ